MKTALFLKKKTKIIDILSLISPSFFFVVVGLHFSFYSDQAFFPHAVDGSWTKYPCGPRGGTPYWAKKRILSYMLLASQQGIVCRVSGLNHCIQLKWLLRALNSVSFWTRDHSKNVRVGDQRSTFVVSTICFSPKKLISWYVNARSVKNLAMR